MNRTELNQLLARELKQSIDKDWPTINRERGRLIDKNVAGTISADEKIRLDTMNEFTEMLLDLQTYIDYVEAENAELIQNRDDAAELLNEAYGTLIDLDGTESAMETIIDVILVQLTDDDANAGTEPTDTNEVYDDKT